MGKKKQDKKQQESAGSGRTKMKRLGLKYFIVLTKTSLLLVIAIAEK